MLRAYQSDTEATGDTRMDFANTPGLSGVRKTYESGMCMVYTNSTPDLYVVTLCCAGQCPLLTFAAALRQQSPPGEGGVHDVQHPLGGPRAWQR